MVLRLLLSMFIFSQVNMPCFLLMLSRTLTVYSRLSLFRLSEVWPPRYTSQLGWHGLLARCLLLTLKLRPPRYAVYQPVLAAPPEILHVYYGQI